MKSRDGIDIKMLGQVLNMSFRLVSNRINSNFRDYGYPVTAEQYTILSYLYQHGELQQNQISKLTTKDEPSVSRIINNMIKNGIVKRVPHPDDRRTNLICLTEKSNAMREGLYKEASLALEQALKDISDFDVENLHLILNQIISNLK